MTMLARYFLALLLCSIVAVPALAGFFDGYTAANSADQQTIDYAVDLEGRAINQVNAIRVDPVFALSGAEAATAVVFRDGVRAAVRSVHQAPTSCESQTPTNVGTVNGWTLYNDAKRSGEFWTNRLFYKQPPGAPETWKRPIVVVNDGMGVYYSTGIASRGYAGENVAQVLLEAGHPVLVMALKGFDDKYFVGAWGVSGINQFESYVRARGDTTVSVWIRDAYDAVCLMQQWFPGREIGVTGVSKSGIVAASAAILLDGVTKVYLASGFSAFEAKFYSINAWAYGFGERAQYERNAILAAMWDKSVRLSYSSNDDISYRVEAVEGRVLNIVNAVRSVWSKQPISQFSTAPTHYYGDADVAAFFAD